MADNELRAWILKASEVAKYLESWAKRSREEHGHCTLVDDKTSPAVSWLAAQVKKFDTLQVKQKKILESLGIDVKQPIPTVEKELNLFHHKWLKNFEYLQNNFTRGEDGVSNILRLLSLLLYYALFGLIFLVPYNIIAVFESSVQCRGTVS